MNSIYDIPTAWLFVILLILVMLISIVGLYLFKMIDISPVICENHNAIVGILIGVMSAFLGVMISFMVVTSWSFYSKASIDNQSEAQSLYVLFEVVSALPNTEIIQDLIIGYLEYIVDIEFPAMKQGIIPPEGEIFIQKLQEEIYNYVPEGNQQTVLYQRSVGLIGQIADFRANRIVIATEGLNSLIWWISIIDSVLIVFMSWFLDCTKLYHYLVVIMIVTYVVAGFFVTVQLSNPYRGDNGISDGPFQAALDFVEKSEVTDI